MISRDSSFFAEACDIAVNAASKAGRYIISKSKEKLENLKIEQKEGYTSVAAQVVTEVDRHAESIILEEISVFAKKYDVGVLGEESLDDGSRLTKDYFWCFDPLDGTLAFINNDEGVSVAIALVRNDGIVMVGVVYEVPLLSKTESGIEAMEGIVYKSINGEGAMVVTPGDGATDNGDVRSNHCHQIRVSNDNTKKSQLEFSEGMKDLGNIKFVWINDRSNRSHPQHEQIKNEIEQYFKENCLQLMDKPTNGGAVMNACWAMITGSNDNGPNQQQPQGKRKECNGHYNNDNNSCSNTSHQEFAAVFFKFPKKERGGGNSWDFAATTCLMLEAGGIVCDINGDPLQLNRKETTFHNEKGVIYCTHPLWIDVLKKVYHNISNN